MSVIKWNDHSKGPHRLQQKLASCIEAIGFPFFKQKKHCDHAVLFALVVDIARLQCFHVVARLPRQVGSYWARIGSIELLKLRL